MKQIYAGIALFATLCVAGQNKIDLQGRIALHEYQNQKAPDRLASGMKSPLSLQPAGNYSESPVVSAIVRLQPGYSASDLEACGYEVTADLNSIALVKVSIDNVVALSNVEAVKQLSFGGKQQLFLDKARAASKTDPLHSGVTFNGKTYKYTGKGVVTGIYDCGIATNHPNFRDASGKTRVKNIYYYPNDSTRYTLSQQGIEQWTCEDSTETHGTHTLGIMAGGYKGDVSVAVEDLATGKATITTKANPYYGLATESDIVVSCGELYDATTVDGMYLMGKYAQDNGQPIVINYSAGSPTGPHDGTDPFAQALAEISSQTGAIICLAAGNSGSQKMSVEKTFSSSSDALKTCVTPMSGYSGSYALLDFWADDERPFSIKFSSFKPKFLFGSDTNTALFTINASGQEFDVVSTSNSALKSAFSEAEVIALSEVNKNNGRFHIMALVYYSRSSTYKSYIHLEITGNAGQHIFGTLANLGEFTAQSGISGSVDGNGDNSISDACTNPALISVGSYNTRQYYGRLDGDVYGQNSGYVDGGISSFSSYGASLDGTQYPEVVAPGNIIISSFNPYYVEQSTDEPATTMSARLTDNGKDYHFGSMSGTSMACPYVAGTIALWLEADPSLTAADVKEIIAKTAIQDSNVSSDALKSGYGKIDAEEGLKEILRRQETQGIVDVESNAGDIFISQGGSSVEVCVPGASAMNVSVYSVQGLTVAGQAVSGDTVTLPTASLAPGIYILEANTPKGRYTRKIAIR